ITFTFYSKGLKALKRIDLSGNSIKSLPQGTFDGCTQLQELNLSHNQISVFETSNYTNATRLVLLWALCNNSIKTVSQSTFHGMRNLVSLDLGDNVINELEEETFEKLCHCTRFNVEYNYITRIESRIFYFNTKLRTILLNHNNIHTVDDGAFEGLSNLTLLDLAGNNITWLPDGIFKPTVNLDTLNLSDNQLVRIDVTYMTTLSVLNLAGNNLAEWTADHENMLSLRLRGNKLTRWKRLNMPNIQKLDLSNNEITTVDYDAFIQCRQLMDLNLSRNYLTTMDKNIVFELWVNTYLKLAEIKGTLKPLDLVALLSQLVSFDIRMNKLT
uniref:Uncharacterized protein n=1 Tax=Ciona intestinalis TaxID=7719 RepID=F6UA31_CIOIN